MNAQVVLRLLDTFFRHRLLYLVPVVALGGVGVWAATSTEDSYQSVGTMKIEATALVAELTGSQQDPGFGWQTPAAATAESLNALMRTQTFVDEVVVTAGLEDAAEQGLITYGEVRGSISVFPDGVRLVKVAGTNVNPEVANRLATATIQTYIETVIDGETRNSDVAVEFLEQKLPEYEGDVAAAEDELAEWLADNPAPGPGEERPENEQVELQRLQSAVALQDQRLTEAQAAIERAELSVEQKEAEVRQRLQVIDPPQVSFVAQSTLKKSVMTVAMALVVGMLVALGAVVVATILDRTVRFPADVRSRLGTRVLAVVPRARVTPALRARLESAELDDAAGVRARTQSVAADLPRGATSLVTMELVEGGDPSNGHRDDVRETAPLKRAT